MTLNKEPHPIMTIGSRTGAMLHTNDGSSLSGLSAIFCKSLKGAPGVSRRGTSMRRLSQVIKP
jgi:hypothetical protein